jgi:hypothetical protein
MPVDQYEKHQTIETFTLHDLLLTRSRGGRNKEPIGAYLFIPGFRSGWAFVSSCKTFR